jgi:hypothetical protein
LVRVFIKEAAITAEIPFNPKKNQNYKYSCCPWPRGYRSYMGSAAAAADANRQVDRWPNRTCRVAEADGHRLAAVLTKERARGHMPCRVFPVPVAVPVHHVLLCLLAAAPDFGMTSVIIRLYDCAWFNLICLFLFSLLLQGCNLVHCRTNVLHSNDQ